LKPVTRLPRAIPDLIGNSVPRQMLETIPPRAFTVCAKALIASAFRIAATDDVVEAILSTLFISIRSSAPGANVVAVSDRVEHDLARGKVDLAIAADWWLRRVRQRETILRDTYVGLRSKPGRLNLAAFLKQDHVLVAPHGRKPGVVDAALKRARALRGNHGARFRVRSATSCRQRDDRDDAIARCDALRGCIQAASFPAAEAPEP
jgi:DNA-binding transcriptional LysR family regulator